ncbi:adenosine kinase [Ponticaulis sp.]|uniref:adenosine kinase n=1 Tax=Ponticaulis sp. TaxID=2020902 RepID=UPI000B735E86|nr:adenosine kinase [Ponticaulis sp.]MAI91044.1 adenosine kinase [Ponticaulis sp.]OUX98593.1 MAG: adenosine kinase [Hyphomonadaceae bacterium TMED5]
MSAVYDVVGVGNAIVDVIKSVPDGFLIEHDIRKGGMTLIDQPRALQLSKLFGTDARFVAGGSGANTIAGVTSFGGKTGYIGKVAEDALGRYFRKAMEKVEIDFPTASLEKGPGTARCIIGVTPDGERSMNTYLGASTEFTDEDVDAEMIKQGKILYLEGYLFDKPEAKKAFVHAAEIAKAANRRVALTLSDSFCVDRHRESFQHLIRGHVDVLFANEAELLSLYETQDFNKAVQLLRKDAYAAAVTRSSKGSVVITPEEVISLPAEPVKKVVDATGAGDQYAAGFLFGYARNRRVRDCAKLGHIAAAEVISHYGPRPEVSYRQLAAKHGLL